MQKIDEHSFRSILEMALADGTVCTPAMVEVVTDYLVTGTPRGINYHEYDDVITNDTEDDIERVFRALIDEREYHFSCIAYEDLLKQYLHTNETTDNCQS